MQYGIEGRSAIVCGSSKGLGKGCAMALAREGVRVTINGRHADSVHETADEIRRATGAAVDSVVADVTTQEGRALLLAATPQPDILVTNAAGPGPGDFRDWDEAAWQDALRANMLAPIELIRATVDGMIARRFGRIVNITSSAVKAPIAQLGLSNGARAGLTCFVAGLARQVARHNVTINNLLPGAFTTDRRAAVIRHIAQISQREAEEVRLQQVQQIPAGRFGDIGEFGAACAFLCSGAAGFIVGQNILLDGGEYPGTL